MKILTKKQKNDEISVVQAGEATDADKSGKDKKAQEADALWKDLIFLFMKIAIIAIFFYGVFTFLFGIHRVNDMQMNSAIREGDIVIYNRLEKDYLWWECVVLEQDGKVQVRRVVATGGDTVEVTEEGLKVNGYLQSERNITEETRRYAEGIEFPVTLTEGQVFVLGDARFNATDSRIYGPVDSEKTLGKVMMVIRRRDF